MLKFIKVLIFIIFIIFHITDQTSVWHLIEKNKKVLLDNRVQDKNNEWVINEQVHVIKWKLREILGLPEPKGDFLGYETDPSPFPLQTPPFSSSSVQE